MAVDNKKNQEQKTQKINFNTNKMALVKTAKNTGRVKLKTHVTFAYTVV